jgi:hypothetical protein
VIGNTGKTWMSRYLLATLRENCIRLENSKSDNIKYAYNGERVVIFDFGRSQADHVNYEVIESVKNGIMFSGKYESCSKTFDIPHVVIFANFEPDLTKLSADRWDVRHFTEDDLKKTNRMSRDIDNKVETAIVIDSSSDEPEVIDITETEVINETTELYNNSLLVPSFRVSVLPHSQEFTMLRITKSLILLWEGWSQLVTKPCLICWDQNQLTVLRLSQATWSKSEEFTS